MKLIAFAFVCLVCLTGSKCIAETPVEICYLHPKFGAVCVKIGGKKYDLNRPDLTAVEQKEVRDWIDGQPK